MAFPENQESGESSVYADAGTARHELSATCLRGRVDAIGLMGAVFAINGKEYTVTEDFAADVQYYIDDVRNRAQGGVLLVEQRVDLQEWLGPDQFGTSDAIIAQPMTYNVTVEDLKSGRGEKVYAFAPVSGKSRFTVRSYTPGANESDATEVEPNFQLMLYALGSLSLVDMLMDEIRTVTIVINQPPLDHIHELTVTMDDMLRFGEFVKDAVAECHKAMGFAPGSADLNFYLNPGEKQCRWCRAKIRCTKLAEFVIDSTRMDFEEVASDGLPARPLVPENPVDLGKAWAALGLISMWMGAVSTEVNKLVGDGKEVIGPDRKPLKFVEGKPGNRSWINEKVAEEALNGRLSEDKVYAPRKLITVAVADKLLNKKATKEEWKDFFEPLIRRPPGSPKLVLGSDPRPPYQKSAGADEFEEVAESDE